MTKEEILAEIRRTTEENGGKPLGVDRFRQATGIKSYDWMRYWPRFGDALRELGFEPNTLNQAFEDDYVLQKAVEFTRELQKFPTITEMVTKRFGDASFPDVKVFRRFGTQVELLTRVAEFADSKPADRDVAELLKPELERSKATTPTRSTKTRSGFVYLFSERPGHYKIGISDDPERRLYELTKGPYKPELVHKFQTDDPSGVEAYWHKRFSGKLMRGEWFRLDASDVNAFKRWRKIF